MSDAHIKKIFIANRGEIACSVIKTARKMGFVALSVSSLALTSCATQGSVPQLASSSQIEKMADASWMNTTTKLGVSVDVAATERLQTIAQKMIIASTLSNEEWEIKLFDSSASNVFALPGNRIGGFGIDKMSDDRVASLAAFGIASIELKHAEQMASRAKVGRMFVGAGKVASWPRLNEKPEDKKRREQYESLSKMQLPPTPKMQEEAKVRATEMVISGGFVPDFPEPTFPF